MKRKKSIPDKHRVKINTWVHDELISNEYFFDTEKEAHDFARRGNHHNVKFRNIKVYNTEDEVTFMCTDNGYNYLSPNPDDEEYL